MLSAVIQDDAAKMSLESEALDHESLSNLQYPQVPGTAMCCVYVPLLDIARTTHNVGQQWNKTFCSLRLGYRHGQSLLTPPSQITRESNMNPAHPSAHRLRPVVSTFALLGCCNLLE